MWYPFSDFDRRSPFNDLFRQLDRAWRAQAPVGPDPSVTLVETPEWLELSLDMPGVLEQDLKLDVHDAQTVTIQARRSLPKREGYAAHRAERQAWEWKKSYTLPIKIDASRTTANLERGVLTVRLAKLPESQPRRVQINVA
ncbi:MAG: Hsp20/alpha crystallin family protein [Deltaproteobacteria bacterium]|nr:Hsp20/alpha crystallin family protein [Deltaproteobacteria bacterium]